MIWLLEGPLSLGEVKGESRETLTEVYSGSDQYSGVEDVFRSGWILDIFWGLVGLDVRCERKRGIRDGTQVLAWTMENLLLKNWQDIFCLVVVGRGMLGFRVLFWTLLRCLLDFQVEMEIDLCAWSSGENYGTCMFGSSQHILLRPMEWEKISKSMGPREPLRLSFRKEEPAKDKKKDEWCRRKNPENMGSWGPSEWSIWRRSPVSNAIHRSCMMKIKNWNFKNRFLVKMEV